MNGAAMPCPSCRGILPDAAVNTPTMTRCPYCNTPVRVAAFPASRAGYLPGRSGEALQEDTEASCFYHPHKRATVPCDVCGRFLCSLCDVVMGDRHLCPGCVEAHFSDGRSGKGGKAPGDRRFLYDSLALSLAIWPLLTCFLTFVTAPLVLFIGIRYWRAPSGMFRWSKLRLAAAMSIAAAEIAVWAVTIAWLIKYAP